MNKLSTLCLAATLASGTTFAQQASFRAFSLPPAVSAADCQPGTIILKVKPAFRAAASRHALNHDAFRKASEALLVESMDKVFPGHQPPAQARNAAGQPLVDLSLIYRLTYRSGADLVKAVNRLLATGLFEYVEPFYLPRPLYNPSDPSTGMQSFLTKINAYAAWDIQTGDTNVVIGIVDTGTDWDHPDLEGNLKYNYADPINGIDDDNDGYTDNYRGWDLADNDNNPMVDGGSGQKPHGSHVSGCAAAVTDNGIGVASPGFHCKFLPVKASQASDPNSYLVKGYEGIVYAADHGCSIINCSWGGGGGSSFGQNAIDYATINKNALVVCAAGNSSNEVPFYPASYDHALSVASTNSNDAKSSFSNYGMYIDVCAPGANIYSTIYNNTYDYSSGTSMASPVAAGAAAIIKSQFPSLTGLQVGERLRMGCDNIYGLGGNAAYNEKLGRGRINMNSSLINNTPSVRFEQPVFSDGNDNAFVIGDTIRVSGDFINYLDPTTSLTVTMTTTSPFVTILGGPLSIGALGTLSTYSNTSSPFQLVVNANAPQNTKISLKLNYMDGLYSDFQKLETVVNVDYINITINDVYTTITSKGRLCYNGTSQSEGLGFFYSGNQLVYEAGLMIGNNSLVSDNVRGATSTDEDFVSQQVVQRILPSAKSEFDLYGIFNDNPAPTPLKVVTTHQAYAWSTPGNSKFVIVEYAIRNNGTSPLTSLYAGVFADWDIMDYSLNRADQDLATRMGYCYSTQAAGLYAGIKLLTGGPFTHYAIDNISGGAGGINMFDGYSDAEKYTSLSTNRAQAGQAGSGNDVIDVVGTGPFSLGPGDSVVVAFALLAGDDLQDLLNGATNAQIKYDGITGINNGTATLPAVASWPNPVSDLWNLAFDAGTASRMTLDVIDAQGRTVRHRTADLPAGAAGWTEDVSDLANGLYLFELRTGTAVHRGRIMVRH